MLVSVFYLIPHLSHSCLANRVLSCSSAMEMAPAQLQEAGQVASSLSSIHSSLSVTLLPQHECTDGIKDKTFHAPVCCQPAQQLRIPALFSWCMNSVGERKGV